MINFIQNQILFYLVLVFVLFLPGYSLLLAIFGKSKTLGALEKFIIAFGLSIISVDGIFFILSWLNIKINQPSVFIGIIIFILAHLIVYKFRKFSDSTKENTLFIFSKKGSNKLKFFFQI